MWRRDGSCSGSHRLGDLMNDYAIETLDLMTGACLMALLAKNHIKSELPKEMIAADYVIGAFDTMLNESQPAGYA